MTSKGVPTTDAPEVHRPSDLSQRRRADYRRLLPRSPMGRRLLLLIVLLGIGAPFAITPIRDWIWNNGASITSVLVGGVLASMLGALLWAFVYDRAIWTVDMERIGHTLNSFDQRLERAESQYADLLRELPNAIGGRFTQSLFAFYPSTSKRIAQILSRETSRLYERHCQRVVVLRAADAYHLLGIQEVTLNGKAYPMWKVEFNNMWKWHNDSRVTQFPLRDFRILVTAPDGAMDSFLQGMTAIRREDVVSKWLEYAAHGNFVRGTAVNPANRTSRMPVDKAGEVFQISALTVKAEQPEVMLSVDQLIEVPVTDLPKTIVYRAYRLPPQYDSMGLAQGHELSIEYSGVFHIPALPYNDPCYGLIEFSPSDLIAKEYTLDFVFPRTVSLNGQQRNIQVDEEESGCYFVRRKKDEYPFSVGATALPTSRFSPTKDEQVARIVIKEELSDYHWISLAWQARS